MIFTHIVDSLHRWTGWCPRSHPEQPLVCMTGSLDSGYVSESDRPDTGKKQYSGRLFQKIFTGVAILILFATLFFGGQFWWPLFVVIVLICGIICHYLLIWRHE